MTIICSTNFYNYYGNYGIITEIRFKKEGFSGNCCIFARESVRDSAALRPVGIPKGDALATEETQELEQAPLLKRKKTMEDKKTKEAALNFIKTAIKHKQEWRKELEEEFKGKDLNVVFL